MENILIEIVEKYYCETEKQADSLVEDAKNDNSFVLKKSVIERKYNKKEDTEYFIVVLTKTMCDIKEIISPSEAE